MRLSRSLLSIPVWCDWRIGEIPLLPPPEIFQFQYGAIEGANEVRYFLIIFLFQFQYGAIEGDKSKSNRIISYAFNSSMVRLKVRSSRKVTRLASHFQFQYGAIEGECFFRLVFRF